MSHTIGFETTQSWTASVRETSRAESWISINPTSGDAGKHTITVTLTENETTESRQAVVIISCGGESANISITQRGVGQDEPEDPDNPNNPDNPQKPEHPDVTWVETTYTEVYSDGSSTDKSYMLFEYDAEGLLTGYDQYDYDSEQTDKINASYEGTLKRSEGKITDEEKWFEIGGSSYEGMPLPNSGEYTKEYRLNASGLVSGYTDPDGASQTFTYNADGTLARLEYRNPSYPDENSTSTLTWQDGNIVSISTIDGRDNETTTFSYTEHLNPWNGIDIGSFAIAGVDDIGCLLGISGTTTKHLPASQQTKYKNSQYQYTFDNEGRVSTIVVTSTFHNPESMENISIATQTEYTLHYGTTPSPEPDYLAYLTDQKIIEEGTLGYIFDGDDPEGEHIVLPNAYTSYAKILNTLSDGTTKETTEYRQVKITLPEEHLGYIYVTQQDIDDFELISVTQEKEDDGKDITSPLTYTFTFEYNCFTEKFRLKIKPPYCNLYSEQTGTWNSHPMPTLPLDDDCIVCYPPEVTQLNDNPIQIDYKFVQKYVIKINPEAEITDQNVSQIDRLLYVRQ